MSSDDILRIVFGSAFCVVFVCLAILLVVYGLKVAYKQDKLKIELLELHIKCCKKYLDPLHWMEDDK